MELPMKAAETEGTLDAQGLLHLDEPLSSLQPGRVRVIVLAEGEPDIDESQWMRSAMSNQAFDLLKDPAEDIYTLADGKPFHDKG